MATKKVSTPKRPIRRAIRASEKKETPMMEGKEPMRMRKMEQMMGVEKYKCGGKVKGAKK